MSTKGGALTEGKAVRVTLIGVALLFLAAFLVLPLIVVFTEAFRHGVIPYLSAISEKDAVSALRLSVKVFALAVPLNVIFGVFAAWAISKYHFPGRSLMVALIDLPYSVSPVIAGLVFVLMFGSQSLLGPILREHGIQVIFSLPGIVLATAFVTFPFVARELIPLMEHQGIDEELAARTLGAGGFRTFMKITLPNIKWGLLYGALLCGARALGEFGAVSVVSGHVRGYTNTLPLHVEILYNEYGYQAAFAVASLLALTALITLALKAVLEWRFAREMRHH